MEKLVYVKYYSGFECSGENVYCFEYESKDKFIYDVLDKFKGKVWTGYKFLGDTFDEEILLLDGLPEILVTKYDVADIENNVFTLEEYFEKYKKVFKL